MLLALSWVLGSDQVKFLMKILGSRVADRSTPRQPSLPSLTPHNKPPGACFVFVTNCRRMFCSNVRETGNPRAAAENYTVCCRDDVLRDLGTARLTQGNTLTFYTTTI